MDHTDHSHRSLHLELCRRERLRCFDGSASIERETTRKGEEGSTFRLAVQWRFFLLAIGGGRGRERARDARGMAEGHHHFRLEGSLLHPRYQVHHLHLPGETDSPYAVDGRACLGLWRE